MRRVTACVFDMYGTLLDLDSAIAPHERALGAKGPAFLALWRAKQLEYTWLRTVMGRHADFLQVTRDALAYAMEAHGLDDPGLASALMDSFRRLSAFPDAVPALESMRAAGIRTAVLSNGTPAMLDEALDSSGLAPLLDAAFSVEPMGRFKPSPPVYTCLMSSLDVSPHEILFVSANAWDAVGAANAGLDAAWINRRGAPTERLPAAPRVVVRSLAELPGLLGGPDLATPLPVRG
jgi:2-haloacid dehalogenase